MWGQNFKMLFQICKSGYFTLLTFEPIGNGHNNIWTRKTNVAASAVIGI